MLKRFFFPLIESFLRNISGGLGRKLRYYYYRTRLGACGKNVFIDIGVIFNNPELIFIGSNVWIGANCVILPGTQIGDEVTIGAGCIIQGIIPSKSTVKKNNDNHTITPKSRPYDWDIYSEKLT